MHKTLTNGVVIVFALLASIQSLASDLVNFHKVNDQLYRSGRLSEEAIAEIAQRGIKTVISIENYRWDESMADQEQEWVESQGMNFHWLPLHPTRKPTASQVDEVLDLLNEVEGPVLIHCKKGADRTGIVVGGYRIRYDNWSTDDAIEELRHPRFGHSRRLYYWDEVLYDIE
jgi:uncharacterized protein (TIGR01244 family)